MTREHIHSYVDLLTEEQIEKLSEVLNALLGGNTWKLLKALDVNMSNVDSAIPVEWSKKVIDLGLSTTGIAWSYQENYDHFGHPIQTQSIALSSLFDAMNEWAKSVNA